MLFGRDLAVSRVPAAGLAAIGAFWGSVAGWLPEIKARAGVSDAEFGALMMLSACGGMLSMALAPRLLRRFGPGLLAASALIVAAVAIAPALVVSRPTLGLALFLMGASMSLCDILANIRISDVEARVGRSLQNLNHAIFSLSLAASAAAMGIMRGAGIPHLLCVVLIALAVLALAMFMRRADRQDAPLVAHSDPADPAMAVMIGTAAPWLVILPGAAILWLSFMAENGTETWAAIHIERTLGAHGGFGAFGPAMFALSMGMARLAGQVLTRVLGPVRLIALSVCLAVLGALALAFAPGLGLAIGGAAALGLGVAVVVPTANSLIARIVEEPQRASAISRAWTLGFTGFFIGPPIMGLVSEGLGLRTAFAMIAVLVALMLPCLWLLSRRLLR